jgi:hypothetical protein
MRLARAITRIPRPALSQCHTLICLAARGETAGLPMIRKPNGARPESNAALLLLLIIGLLVCHERERERRGTRTTAMREKQSREVPSSSPV